MECSLCGLEAVSTERVAGLDLCTSCRADPEAPLRSHDIVIEWTVSMGVFSASASGARIDPSLGFTCATQGLHHRAIKLFVDEVEVGDPIFDDRVYVRASDREGTAAVLASEGVQSAILTFLVGMRNDRFVFSHVTVDDGRVTVRAIPMDGVSEDVELELRWNLAALVAHLNGLVAPRRGR